MTMLSRSEAFCGEQDVRRAMNGFLPRVMFVCTLALSQVATAQSSNFQWWPEWDTYVSLNSRTRVSFTVSRKDDGLTPGSVQIGPNIDLSVKPLLRRRLRTNDESAYKYLSFGAGYRYIVTVDNPSEHRVLLEATPRFPLPLMLLLSDRQRADLRVINGQFSWRYRNRLMVERSFKIKHLSLTPFARGELLYNSHYDLWNQNSYSFGTTIPIRHRLDLEPFYEHRNNSQSSPQHIDALGFTISLYLRSNRSQ